MTKKKTKIIGIGIVAVLLIGLIPIVSGEEDEPIDVYVVEQGGKDLTFLQKFFQGFWVYGGGDIQLGKGSAHTGDPPRLTNPATTFSKGDTVGMIFTARDCRSGATQLNVKFNGQPANIFYKPGVGYVDYISIDGDWDVWWFVTAFSAKNEGTITVEVWQHDIDRLASKTFTVKGMMCSPNQKVCDGDNLKTCKSDGSGWSYEYCWYGCSAGACNPKPAPTPTPDPCESVVCPDKCVGDTLYYSGYCQYGSCQYSTRFCQYGCEAGACKSAHLPTPTPTPTITPTPTPTNGVTPTPPAYPPQPAGFESIFAIAGFLAVAYLIIRRRK